MEYIIYCDESSDSGPKYSDFFGGCIINASDYSLLTDALNAKKIELNLLGEIKWTKVTRQYLEKYIQIIDLFFDFVCEGKIKVRVMFRKNDAVSSNQDKFNHDDKYFKLYYQFIKHAFGLRDLPPEIGEINVRVYLDKLPDTHEKCEQFKDFVRSMPETADFRPLKGRLHIRKEDVADVCSHDHVLLQCVDIVLGAMFFRLNHLNLVKPEGSRTRGKRTLAKEKLYNHIYRRIADIFPNFNIGVSTGWYGEYPSWAMPYRHWSFTPKK